MQRRDFLKYLMTISSCVCSGCSFMQKNKYNDNKIEVIKFSLCYHCNLNCAYCNHFSPIAPKYELSDKIFENDIRQLKKITNGKVGAFEFMGGEPLLNKNIEKILYISNKYFPDTRKTIVTNGLLLKDMDENFWRACKKNNITISVSNYTKGKYLQKNGYVEKKSNDYDISLTINDNIECFANINLSKNSTVKPCTVFECPQIDNGIFAPCTVIAYIKFFNNYFKEYALPVVESDYLNIYNISSMDEIYKFLDTPKNFCKYCGYGHKEEFLPWKLSEKKVSEWYQI